MNRRIDTGAACAGVAIIAIGTLLLLQEGGAFHLPAGWLISALLAVTGVALVASGAGARGR